MFEVCTLRKHGVSMFDLCVFTKGEKVDISRDITPKFHGSQLNA